MDIKNFFAQHKIILQQKKLVIAASGGPDSMALLEMLNRLKKSENFTLIVAHFDHQLRNDSKLETQLLMDYCDKNHLSFENGIWHKNEQPIAGIEAAARHFRYAFLSRIVEKYQADYLLTAHHGDDLLENILLKFIRSGNPSEMDSLQAVSQMHGTTLLRPLLAYSKAELLQFDLKNKIAFVEDETNNEDDTLRNRLRHHVVPLLKQENPKLIENALRFSEDERLVIDLANERMRMLARPELFLDFIYRVRISDLASLSQNKQIYFWQQFIWHTWHRRVNERLAGFNLVSYQNYYYLWSNSVELGPKKSFLIKQDHPFIFRGQSFLLSAAEKDLPIIGDFWSNEKIFTAGSLPAGSKLTLKNGQHAKAKKMFAQAAIPKELRSLCLTIFNQKGEAVFIEKCYQDQKWIENGQHYFLYQLKNK